MKILDLTRKFLLEEYVENKKTMREIATEVDCAYSTIHAYIKLFDIPVRTGHLTGNRNKTAQRILTKKFLEKEYVGNKKSITRIAKDVNIHRSTVYGYMRRLGLGMRSLSDAGNIYFALNEPKRFIGNKPGNFKGRIRTEKGYIYIHTKDHPCRTKNNCVFEHRLVMEKRLGRYLEPNEIVHHINGMKDDNRDENLFLMERSNHDTHTIIKILQRKIRDLENKLLKGVG